MTTTEAINVEDYRSMGLGLRFSFRKRSQRLLRSILLLYEISRHRFILWMMLDELMTVFEK